uniref:Uncharacterized protein n=1 Tax=Anguilla anguilla TaxID=7936 RepID=A0A0E9SDT0_ANGAN
MQVTDTRS